MSKMQIRALNRLTGKSLLARKKSKAKIRIKKKPTTNFKKLNRMS